MLLVDTFCRCPKGDSSTHVWTVTDNILETSIIIANSFWGLITAPDFICFTDINPNKNPTGQFFYLYFTLEEPKAQRGEGTCSRSHSLSVVGPELKPHLLSIVHLFNEHLLLSGGRPRIQQGTNTETLPHGAHIRGRWASQAEEVASAKILRLDKAWRMWGTERR